MKHKRNYLSTRLSGINSRKWTNFYIITLSQFCNRGHIVEFKAGSGGVEKNSNIICIILVN